MVCTVETALRIKFTNKCDVGLILQRQDTMIECNT